MGILELCEALEHNNVRCNVVLAGSSEHDDNQSAQEELYKRWKKYVNMTADELERFLATDEGKEAGLSRKEAKKQGINSGQDSARAIIRMKRKKFSEWSSNDYKWARDQISFILRMSGMAGKLYKDADKKIKTRKHTSLLLWGHDPTKP